jgi:alpha-D-xyloside xylohydrolase
VVPFGAVEESIEYDWADGVTLRVHAPADGTETVTAVPSPDGSTAAVFRTRRDGATVTVETDSDRAWQLLLVGATEADEGGEVTALGARYACRAGTHRLTARLA